MHNNSRRTKDLSLLDTLMKSLMPAFDLHNYRGRVSRVIDGDTLQIDVDLGLNVLLQKQILRLKGSLAFG